MKYTLPKTAATTVLLCTAASTWASQCQPSHQSSEFLPTSRVYVGLPGQAPIICGLPASQNVVLGAGEDAQRARVAQQREWKETLEKSGKPTAPDVVELKIQVQRSTDHPN